MTPADPGAIQKATVDLGGLTAEALAHVYREPKADITATDNSAAATSDSEAHEPVPRSPRPVGTDV